MRLIEQRVEQLEKRLNKLEEDLIVDADIILCLAKTICGNKEERKVLKIFIDEFKKQLNK